ncbi:MAG: VOC family protein [Sphingobacteriaceae bacterium]|nr:VOC family protein [Sphingobacteriaceae bacterium]
MSTGKITGIGGIFFKSKDVKTINNWYYKNLGLIPNDYGSLFEWKSTVSNSVGYTQWSPFSYQTKYFLPSSNNFMVNYRVDNLQKLYENFKANGVIVLDSIEVFEYGKFLHILDCDSNKIELWEPVDSVFTNLYKTNTTK